MNKKTIITVIIAAAMAMAFIACRANKTKQVIINSEPQGATVFINQEVVGQTPVKKELTFENPESERHVIILRKDGYRPQRRYFYFQDNSNILFQLEKRGGE